MSMIIIDVREKDEFKNEQVFGSINLPLSSFLEDAPAILEKFENRKIVLTCLSGKRAGMALGLVQNMPALNIENYEVYKKGIKGWREEGEKVVESKKGQVSMMRQVQIVAGSLIVLGALLGTFFNPSFWFLSGFVGVGLTFSGLSGTCAMAEVLKLMPWNK